MNSSSNRDGIHCRSGCFDKELTVVAEADPLSFESRCHRLCDSRFQRNIEALNIHLSFGWS